MKIGIIGRIMGLEQLSEHEILQGEDIESIVKSADISVIVPKTWREGSDEKKMHLQYLAKQYRERKGRVIMKSDQLTCYEFYNYLSSYGNVRKDEILGMENGILTALKIFGKGYGKFKADIATQYKGELIFARRDAEFNGGELYFQEPVEEEQMYQLVKPKRRRINIIGIALSMILGAGIAYTASEINSTSTSENTASYVPRNTNNSHQSP